MKKQRHHNLRVLWLALLALAAIAPVVFVSSVAARRTAEDSRAAPQRKLPETFDVRGPGGVPRGTSMRAPAAAQAKALNALQTAAGVSLQVRYNGLTGTPSHLFSLNGYLSAPSNDAPEKIARDFLNRWKGVFRFSQEDVDTLRLKSRAYLRDLGATILVFEQRAKELPVYHGEVMVNVNRVGQIIDVGSESFPQLQVDHSFTLTPAQAIAAAADALDIKNFSPQSLGTTQVLRSFGNAPTAYAPGERFSGGGVFTDDIVVERVAFPMGDKARPAYEFVLTTPQYSGIMWLNIVDAQTGQVLRRSSLTAFQKNATGKRRAAGAPEPNFGPPGGGNGVGRLATFRPDLQDSLEANNSAGTAQGRVFDAAPTALSGPGGTGRPAMPGPSPTYQSEATLTNHFRFSLVDARRENPLVYSAPFGQVTRGLPDAANPSAESPFGWFYLPTGTGGTEITEADNNRASTRAFGYTMATEAKTRNDPTNSPNGDGDQPFSATLTAITPKTLADGRTLAQVFQSSYTEGNNVLTADDHANDNETTHGIRGFSLMRQFNSTLFNYLNSYEFGGVDAGGDPFYPPTAFPDVYPGTVSLFYYNNIMHDYMYSIGFTEQLWNFQQDNFGRGGAGKDAVSAQVQDGSGTDNANFGTPNDGGTPRMQMFLFTDGSFRRSDGDFDFDVVGHEWTHGTSNRSVGKGEANCLGLGLIGEPSGQGEGWSDYYASSMTDDDSEGEYVTGEFDRGIRRLPYTNYRWSYGAANGTNLNRRDQQQPGDIVAGGIPFEAHDIGELWCATLWDMRELLIMKDPNGVFFDGNRRLGSGTNFYIGTRQVQSVDTQHPINYRASFNDSNGTTATINAANHIVRPGLIAAEIAANAGNRTGPLATAVRNGALLSDTLVLRGMQLSVCNPSFVDSRDAILLADREMTGGENQAIVWRAFASHGVGVLATSDSSADPSGTTTPTIVEDFSVPAGVTQCETLGPLAPPSYSLSNTQPNTVTVTIVPNGAALYIISRATSANGPFTVVGTTTTTTFNDDNGGQGLSANQTFYYQVRASRTSDQTCVSTANTQSITIVVGQIITPAPVFAGVDQVLDPAACNRLIVSWQPATSLNPTADIVYDVYRTDEINPDTVPDPTFTPSVANRVAHDLRALSFIDTNNGSGLKLNRVQYYIVQAHDLNNDKIDTNNTGNRVAKFNAPSAPGVTATVPFAFESFDAMSADTRFAPPLTESSNDPNNAVQNFQRVTGVQVGNISTNLMFAPDFDPADDGTGATSNFSAAIGPLSLQPTSVLEFDHFFSTEATFDGGTLEISSDPSFGGNNATPFPNNTNTYDLGNYIVQGGYNGKLDGTLAGGVILSPLQGRHAYTGAKGLHHVRVPLEDFATGGQKNPGGLPMYIRFHMTSDVATSNGPNSGWYIDNVVVQNLDLASCPALNPFQPGDVLISEFRTRGAAGATDEFIELYNNTNAPIQVSSGDGSGGWGLVADINGSPQVIATIPDATNIPARGHYLIANSTNPNGYSLGGYPGGNNGATTAADRTYTTDIPDGAGLALFTSANLASIGTTNRIDAVGFTTESNALLREGAGLSSPGANDGEYSFVRRMAGTGLPRDTNDNAADFAFVSTAGTQFGGVQSTLGAPGPENAQSPIQRNAQVKASVIDPECSGGSNNPTTACARVRDTSDTGPNKTLGTLSIRRRFKNTTNQAITRLRFRIVDITTAGNRAPTEADLRVLTSSDISVTPVTGPAIPVKGTTIETPPGQPNGGGMNTSLTVGTITVASPIGPGASVNVQFLLGVEAGGNFRFFVNVEALP